MKVAGPFLSRAVFSKDLLDSGSRLLNSILNRSSSAPFSGGETLSKIGSVVRCMVTKATFYATNKPMSANPTASEYLLLFRNNAWYQDLTPGEIEEVMGRFNSWFEQLNKAGKVKSGGPLAAAGKTVTSRHMVTDGPFAESKEAVAGFFGIQAESLDEAVEIAKRCPGLEFGQTVEVRAFTKDAFENEKARVKAAEVDSGS